jgi:hypothetical protein
MSPGVDHRETVAGIDDQLIAAIRCRHAALLNKPEGLPEDYWRFLSLSQSSKAPTVRRFVITDPIESLSYNCVFRPVSLVNSCAAFDPSRDLCC